jgi:hypothetical protein
VSTQIRTSYSLDITDDLPHFWDRVDTVIDRDSVRVRHDAMHLQHQSGRGGKWDIVGRLLVVSDASVRGNAIDHNTFIDFISCSSDKFHH